jgi:hypothetical protein
MVAALAFGVMFVISAYARGVRFAVFTLEGLSRGLSAALENIERV